MYLLAHQICVVSRLIPADPTSALMECCERLEINVRCHNTRVFLRLQDFFWFTWRDKLLTRLGWKVLLVWTGAKLFLLRHEFVSSIKGEMFVKLTSKRQFIFPKSHNSYVTTNLILLFCLCPLFLWNQITTPSLCNSAYVSVVLGTRIL